MSLFSPTTWPFDIQHLPKGACLVGGSVRDELLNRKATYLDLDFVLPTAAIKTASDIASAYDAGFVVLDKERHIARVVFEQVTVDFAQQQGDSIETDLQRRDFTVNAIAYNPHTQTFIDPLQGKADIASKTLRMVSYHNLADDPLRLMRAYRQAAQLGFIVETSTQTAIAQLAPALQTVSVERIRSELDALLTVPNAHPQLSAIWQVQLLTFCLPSFTESSVEQIAAIDEALTAFQKALPDYAQSLSQWDQPVPTGVSRSWIKAAKLSCLLSQEPKVANTELTQLKYSRAETQAICTLLKANPYINLLSQRPLTRAEQFFLFKTAGAHFPAVSLLAKAKGAMLKALRPLIQQFLDPDSTLAHAPTLITGDQLMKILELKPGPAIGKLLTAVEQAQAEGKIETTENAIAWLKTHHST
ncbi:MAG: CCA tRNA nucleotidyltransferase [Cyanobacteria bacterium J06607_10]